MSGPTPTQGTVVGALTDGTGVSQLTLKKLFKDFVADFLIGASAALVGAQIIDVGAAIQTPQVVAFAILGAAFRAGYRAILRWATTD